MFNTRRFACSWGFIVLSAAFLFVAATSHAATATITFDSPNGGEVYAPGQTQYVRLGSKTPAKVVKVELSRDGGTTFELLGSIDNSVKDLTLRNVLSYTAPRAMATSCSPARPATRGSMAPWAPAARKGFSATSASG